MPEDRSLDEFGGSDADTDPTETETTETGLSEIGATETEPGDTADDDSSPAESNDSPTIVDDPIPATATATWTTGGADCERCGDSVERRWLDDGDRVCLDCKSW